MLLYVSCDVLRGHSHVIVDERAVTRWVRYMATLSVVSYRRGVEIHEGIEHSQLYIDSVSQERTVAMSPRANNPSRILTNVVEFNHP